MEALKLLKHTGGPRCQVGRDPRAPSSFTSGAMQVQSDNVDTQLWMPWAKAKRSNAPTQSYLQQQKCSGPQLQGLSG